MTHPSHLYALTQSFTLLCLGLFSHDFFTYGAHPVGNNLVVVYLALLSAYAADKELGRWTRSRGEAQPRRRGSAFVVAWAVFYAGAYLAEHFQSGYRVPEGLAKVVVSVVGVFFGSGLSKRFHAMLRGEGEAWAGEEPALAEAARRVKGESELRKQALQVLLKANPQGLSAAELERASRIPRRSLFRELGELEQAGLVERVGVSRSARYRLKAR